MKSLVFENKNFARVFYAFFISQIGTNVHRIALLYLVYSLTNQAIWVSFVIAAQVIATIVIAPLLSAWAERQSPRRLLIISDLLRAPLVLLIPYVGVYSLEALLVLVFLIEIIRNLHDPVTNAVIPQLVPENQIDSANGLILFADSFSEVAFVAVAGLLIAAFGPQFAFWVDALSYVVSALILFGLSHLEPGTGSRTDYWSQVKAGVTCLFEEGPVRRTVSTLFIAAMFGTMTNVLGVVLAVSVLNVGSAGFGVIEGIMALGTVIGTLVIPQFTNRISRDRVFLLGLLGCGLFQASIGTLPVFEWVLVASFMLGLLNMAFLIPARSILQLNVTPELRTRVFIAFGAVMRGAVLIGTMLSGILASYIRVPWIFILDGVMVVFVALWSSLQRWVGLLTADLKPRP